MKDRVEKIMRWDDISFDDDNYVDDIIAKFFTDDNSGQIVSEGQYFVADGLIKASVVRQNYDDVEPTDYELDAIESASV